MPTQTEKMHRKAFYILSVSLTEGNRQPFFFFSKNLPFCIAGISSQSDAMQISAQNISSAKCLPELRETLQSQNYLHSESNVL